MSRGRGHAALVATAVAAVALGASAREEPERPNVVLFLVDDLGWADTGVYGSPFYETPHIDRLAAEGTRFTRFYAASPVCSPTRASLMSGKHPARLALTNWIGGEANGRLLQAEYQRALPREEVTLGEAFAAAGYRTGYIGKWHLGTDGHMPADQGFAWTRAVNRAGQPASYFPPYRTPDGSPTDVPDLEDGAPGEYLTDRLTDEAIGFLRESRDAPFLLVFSHYAVHTPLEAKPDLVARHSRRASALPDAGGEAFTTEGETALTRTRQDHPVYAGMVSSLDESLGRLLGELDSLEMARRTVVALVSDNGGLSTLHRGRRDAPTSNRPLRAGKGWLYEGGIRVPFLIRWPGVVEAGRAVETPAITTDVYPTLLDLAGLPPRPAQHRDGVSLGFLLRGGTASAPRDLFWHFPHYHGSGNTPSSAVLSGDLKLVEWLEDDRVELYDLATDPGEGHDVAGAHRSDAARLRSRLRAWREEIGARMPSPNPDWSSAAPGPPASNDRVLARLERAGERARAVITSEK